MKKQTEVLIIGAGLTGLTIAYLLKQRQIPFHIVEGRARKGGRIHTVYSDDFAPVEMGATWLGMKHTHLTNLLKELNLSIFQQEIGEEAIYEMDTRTPPQLFAIPTDGDPNYRIAGGSSRLINTLYESTGEGNVTLGEVVKDISLANESVVVNTGTNQYEAGIVISTIPPRLLIKSISITPELPKELVDVAEKTHTWMEESTKVAVTYEDAFWKINGSKGTIFSRVGPLSEVYDHSNVENNRFALKGFLDPAYERVGRAYREEKVIAQLVKYFGPKASKFLTYEEYLWSKDPLTHISSEEFIVPHMYNGHPIFREDYLNGKLILAGTETAKNYPGYMDGAVESAFSAVDRIEKIFEKSAHRKN